MILVASLAKPDPVERRNARLVLEVIGEPAVPHLIFELRDPAARVREEAIKALGAIADSHAIPALIEALEDPNSTCRWCAAEALVGMGEEALIPLLKILETGADSTWLRRGVHHVLKGMMRFNPDALAPVLRAFLSEIPEIDVPKAAVKARVVLEQGSLEHS